MKLLRRLLALIPTKIPQGVTEFNAWADDILDIYDMPNNDSTKFALATTVMHLGSTDAYKAKEYFGRILIKGAGTQVAYAVMQECKARQEAKAKEEAEELAKKQQEATSSVDLSDVNEK